MVEARFDQYFCAEESESSTAHSLFPLLSDSRTINLFLFFH